MRFADGTIQAVADGGSLAPVAGERRIDGAGKTLLPGLIDSHAHFESHGEALWDVGLPKLDDIGEAYLYAGVTTALVMQGSTEQFDYFHRAEQGKVASPHLYMAGPRVTAPNGFPINLYRALLPWPLSSLATRPMKTAANAEEARAVVDETALEFSPTFYKITSDAFPPGAPKLSTEAMVAAIQRAKEKGMRPTAHIGAPEDVLIAGEAGLELFAHPPTSAVFTDAQVARLAQLKIPFVSTQRFLTATEDLAQDHGTPLDHAIVRADTLEKFANRPADFRYPGVPEGMDVEALLAKDKQNLRENALKVWRAGIPLFVGTDAGSPGVIPGSSLHRELRALVAAGMPPTDVLKAATSAPADFLDPQHRFGRVRVGQRADLLLVKGDPTQDIAATEAIVEVFQDGKRLARSRR